MDKLDAGISKRPSRFDRKYHFALPAIADRTRYCEFWRSAGPTPRPSFFSFASVPLLTTLAKFRRKISKTSKIPIPASSISLIAKLTEGFSFAYLQEAFVTTLLSIATARLATTSSPLTTIPSSNEGENFEFYDAMRKEVKTLKKEMQDSKKSVEDAQENSVSKDAKSESGGSSVGFGGGR